MHVTFRKIGLVETEPTELAPERGFTAAYSRVWWTNAPSLRVNRKCGWTRVGATLRLSVPWRNGPYLVDWER